MKEVEYKKNLLYLIVIGAVVFLLLLKSVGFTNAIDALKQASKKLFLLALALQLTILLLRSFRWGLLLKDIKEGIPLSNLFILTLAGAFVNNITPGARVGGEPLRVYWLKKKFDVKVGKGLATVVVERIFDFSILTVLAILGYFYVVFFLDIDTQRKLVITALMVIMLLFLSGVLKIVFSETVAMKILKWVPKRFKEGYIEAFWSFRESSVGLIKEGNLSVKMIIITLVLWLFDILRTFIIFYSLDSRVSFLGIAMVLTLTLFLATIPLLPGGLGIIEGTMIGLYVAIEVPLQISVVVTLIDRFISFWLMILFGGIATIFAKIKD